MKNGVLKNFDCFCSKGFRYQHLRSNIINLRTSEGKVFTWKKKSNKFNPNQPGCRTPWYILLYNFSVTHPNVMKFGDFSWNLSGINVLDFLVQNPTGFCSVSIFHGQVLIFMHVFCWNNEYIHGNISRIWVQ